MQNITEKLALVVGGIKFKDASEEQKKEVYENFKASWRKVHVDNFGFVVDVQMYFEFEKIAVCMEVNKLTADFFKTNLEKMLISPFKGG